VIVRLVLVESPFAGPGNDYDPVYREYARRALLDCFMRNECGLASHILYGWSGVLDDRKPSHRALGINAGLSWGRAAADATVVYEDYGVTTGMAQGIDAALSDRRKIEYRKIGKVE
jgi:hypothetical protein